MNSRKKHSSKLDLTTIDEFSVVAVFIIFLFSFFFAMEKLKFTVSLNVKVFLLVIGLFYFSQLDEKNEAKQEKYNAHR